MGQQTGGWAARARAKVVDAGSCVSAVTVKLTKSFNFWNLDHRAALLFIDVS